MKLAASLILYFTIISYANAAGSMGPIGKIMIESIYKCEEQVSSDKISINVDIKKNGATNTKSLFLTGKTTIPLDDKITYDLDVTKWENSGWKKVIRYKGNLCGDATKFLNTIFIKLLKQLTPSVSGCPIPPGTYTLNGFQANALDFKIPVIYYGKLKVIIKILLGDEVLFCTTAEATSQSLI